MFQFLLEASLKQNKKLPPPLSDFNYRKHCSELAVKVIEAMTSNSKNDDDDDDDDVGHEK